MANTDLLTLLQELVATYDASIDTTSGSSFYTKVLTPFMDRVGDKPFDLDLEEYLVDRISVEINDIDVSKGSVIRDLVVRPMAVMLEPLRREINSIRNVQSLNNYSSMTASEVDQLLGNYFISMGAGAKAGGKVRVYFNTPQTVSISTLTEFSTASGLLYFPTVLHTISSAKMTFNRSGSFYYIDVAVEAEEVGTSYNVSAVQVVSVDGIPSAVKVENLSAITDGVLAETTTEAVARARDSITIRNLSTYQGISTLISESYPSLDKFKVVGFGDVEMIRDVVVGPSDVSKIPGGFIGKKDPDIPSASIHLGGKTDVYIYEDVLNTVALDITNVTDVGTKVLTSGTGYTEPISSNEFKDNRGLFQTIEVQVGDIVGYLNTTFQVTNIISESVLKVTPNPPTGLFGVYYEIIRKNSSGSKVIDGGRIQIPLSSLVAISEGDSVVDAASGDYVTPTPGDPDLGALIVGGNNVIKTENVSSENLNLPLIDISSIEFLDPITGAQSGDFIPRADVVRIESLGITSGAGSIRIFTKDACSAWVADSRVGSTSNAVNPTFSTLTSTDTVEPVSVGSASLSFTIANGVSIGATDNIILGSAADPASHLIPGNWIYIAAHNNIAGSDSVHLIESIVDPWTGGVPFVTISVRKDILSSESILSNSSGGSQSTSVYNFQGTRYSSALQDSASGLYYFDVEVQNAAGNPTIASGIEMKLPSAADTGLYVEGYLAVSDGDGQAFSTRERPFIDLTPYVLNQNLRKTSTAYSIRVAYTYGENLSSSQAFVEDESRRIVAEDVLVKSFLPVYAGGTISATGIVQTVGQELLENFIKNSNASANFEISDIVAHLYDNGATHVQFPITLTIRRNDQRRSISCESAQNSVTLTSIEKLIPDLDLIFAVI